MSRILAHEVNIAAIDEFMTGLNSLFDDEDLPLDLSEARELAQSSLTLAYPQLRAQLATASPWGSSTLETAITVRYRGKSMDLLLQLLVHGATSLASRASCGKTVGEWSSHLVHLPLCAARSVVTSLPDWRGGVEVVVSSHEVIVLDRTSLTLRAQTAVADLVRDVPADVATAPIEESAVIGAILLRLQEPLLVLATRAGVILAFVADDGQCWAQDTAGWPDDECARLAQLEGCRVQLCATESTVALLLEAPLRPGGPQFAGKLALWTVEERPSFPGSGSGVSGIPVTGTPCHCAVPDELRYRLVILGARTIGRQYQPGSRPGAEILTPGAEIAERPRAVVSSFQSSGGLEDVAPSVSWQGWSKGQLLRDATTGAAALTPTAAARVIVKKDEESGVLKQGSGGLVYQNAQGSLTGVDSVISTTFYGAADGTEVLGDRAAAALSLIPVTTLLGVDGADFLVSVTSMAHLPLADLAAIPCKAAALYAESEKPNLRPPIIKKPVRKVPVLEKKAALAAKNKDEAMALEDKSADEEAAVQDGIEAAALEDENVGKSIAGEPVDKETLEDKVGDGATAGEPVDKETLEDKVGDGATAAEPIDKETLEDKVGDKTIAAEPIDKETLEDKVGDGATAAEPIDKETPEDKVGDKTTALEGENVGKKTAPAGESANKETENPATGDAAEEDTSEVERLEGARPLFKTQVKDGSDVHDYASAWSLTPHWAFAALARARQEATFSPNVRNFSVVERCNAQLGKQSLLSLGEVLRMRSYQSEFGADLEGARARTAMGIVALSARWQVWAHGKVLNMQTGRSALLPVTHESFVRFAVIPETGPWLLQYEDGIWTSIVVSADASSPPTYRVLQSISMPSGARAVAGHGPCAYALVTVSESEQYLLQCDATGRIYARRAPVRAACIGSGSTLFSVEEGHLRIDTQSTVDLNQLPYRLSGALRWEDTHRRVVFVESLHDVPADCTHLEHPALYECDDEMYLVSMTTQAVSGVLVAHGKPSLLPVLCTCQLAAEQELHLFCAVLYSGARLSVRGMLSLPSGATYNDEELEDWLRQRGPPPKDAEWRALGHSVLPAPVGSCVNLQTIPLELLRSADTAIIVIDDDYTCWAVRLCKKDSL